MSTTGGILESNVVAAALREQGVGYRNRTNAVVWWLFSKPGEAMILVRYGAPNLRIDHDGNVTEVTPPDTKHFTRTSTT